MISKLINLPQLRQLNYACHFNKVTLVEQPKLKKRTVVPIYPPPGLNLQLPEWPVEKFMLKIGKGCSEYADKFESVKDVFESDRMKEKGVPAVIRRYLFSIREQMRRGVLTFEYLERRTAVVIKKAKK